MARAEKIAEYRLRMAEIHGDLQPADAHLFEILDSAQNENGIRGDLLEIGIYQGQTAILMGLLTRDTERLHLCDRFDSPVKGDKDFLPGTLDYYQPYGQQVFEANYLEFHEQLPTVHVCSSLELHQELKPASFRLVHIDGSHRRETVHSDIELARGLLVDGGIIAFHSYRSVATLEVAAAVWETVTAGALTPVCATETKIYMADPSRSHLDAEDLMSRIRAIPSLTMSTPPFGDRTVPLVSAEPNSRVEGVKRFIPPVLLPYARSLKRRFTR